MKSMNRFEKDHRFEVHDKTETSVREYPILGDVIGLVIIMVALVTLLLSMNVAWGFFSYMFGVFF